MCGPSQFICVLACLLLTPATIQAQQEEGKGSAAKCKNPTGFEGATYTEGCTQFTCTKAKRKLGIWVDRPNIDDCCFHQGTGYQIGDVINVTVTNCTETSLVCERREGLATIVACSACTCFQEILTKLDENGQGIDEVLTEVIENGENIQQIIDEMHQGFLISGGQPSSSMKKVEIYNPISGNLCPVQDLEAARWAHTSCSGLVCGGTWDKNSTQRSCEKISGTEVSSLPSLTLRQKRWGHLCWSLPCGDEIRLLGGIYSGQTTEEIVSESSSSDAFQLPYYTDRACSIVVGDSLIVTGGYGKSSPGYALDTVAKFNQSGLVEYLPPLNQRRYYHACSSFISHSGETVLLVTGGAHYVGSLYTRLDSTEILECFGQSWKTLSNARLPSPRRGLKAGTANNVVYIFGGTEQDDVFLNTILFLSSSGWHPVGQNMTVARDSHAVEVIDDVSQYLQPLLSNQDFLDKVKGFLPAGEKEDGKEITASDLKGTVQSPQFQQALSMFSIALQSGQLAPLVREFGLGEDAILAATQGDMDQFVKALQKKEGGDKDKPEDMALD